MDITTDNWEKSQQNLDKLYDKVPKELEELVRDIVDLEIELEKVSNV